MKTEIRTVAFFALSACIFFAAKAQDQGVIELQVKGKDSIPSFIIFKETGKRFLHGHEKDVFKKYLKLTNDDELKKESAENDDLGFTHEKYAQLYKGVKVEYAEYVVHSKSGEIESMNGNFKRIGKIDVTPKISEEIALRKALGCTGARAYMWEVPEMEQWIKKERNDATATFYPKGEIVIVQNRLGDGGMRLAYKFDIYASEPVSRNYVYVDANTGAIVNIEAIMLDYAETNNADTRYSGPRHIDTYFQNGKYRLSDYTRGKGIEVWNLNAHLMVTDAVPFEDSDNIWSAQEWDNPEKDNAALDALWAAQMAYDYFKVKHKRNSYDNQGGLIKCYVHFGYNFDGARYDGANFLLGDGEVKYKPLTAIDAVVHEIGHAFCKSSVYLNENFESMALQEGFSDIWGACVKNYAAPEKNIWLSGDEINKISFCTRSMSNPNSKGHPDTYKGNYWYFGTDENVYRHTNCNVLNHWFYLLSVGGKGVSGIGIEDAAKIVYRMEDAKYLESGSGYADARLAALKAAKDKFGVNSVQVIQTGKAWYAVGVGEENVIPVITDYQIRGGRDNVTYNSIDAFYVTPATGATSYRWTVIPYSMSCSSDKLPYFVSSNTGTSVSVKHGTCSGKYILRCEAVTYYSLNSYKDRVINVYNPSGGGSVDPDPCDAVLSIYPNPGSKGESITLQIQYPVDPCDEYPYIAADVEQELSVYDLSGNLVIKENFNSNTYTFRNSDLKKDVYILVLKDKKGKLHQKRLTIE